MNRTELHRIVKEEFRKNLTSDDEDLHYDTDGVVVLSAAPLKDSSGKVTEEASPENVARIEKSINIILKITAHRIGKHISEVTEDDIKIAGPKLILNGETEQLDAMRDISRNLGFPESTIIPLDCGRRGVANTKTQFEAINIDPRFAHMDHLTFVTTGYHVPRVKRSANKQLTQRIGYDVISVPRDKYSNYDVFRTVRGEISRIDRYEKSGDISSQPERDTK